MTVPPESEAADERGKHWEAEVRRSCINFVLCQASLGSTASYILLAWGRRGQNRQEAIQCDKSGGSYLVVDKGNTEYRKSVSDQALHEGGGKLTSQDPKP